MKDRVEFSGCSNNYNEYPNLSYCMPKNCCCELIESGKKDTLSEREISGELIDGNVVKEALFALRMITLEITEKCDLSCKYCIHGGLYSNKKNSIQKDLSFNYARLLIDHLVEIWREKKVEKPITTTIGFHGGEPLVNFSFIVEMVDYLQTIDKNLRQFTFSMVTNGILLDRYIDFIVDNNISLLVSLDGGSYNNSYRIYKNGKPSFSKLVSNLDFVQDKYPDYFNRHINFISVLHDRNSTGEIQHFIKTRYGKLSRINELESFDIDNHADFRKIYKGRETTRLLIDNIRHLGACEIAGDRVNSMLRNYFIKKSANVFQSYDDLLYGSREVKYLRNSCQPFGKKLFLSVDGNIAFCQTIYKRHITGRVTDSGVYLDPEKIANNYNSLVKKILLKCFDCYFSDECDQCMFKVIDKYGNVDCPDRVTEGDYVKYLSFIWKQLESNPEIYSEFYKEYE